MFNLLCATMISSKAVTATSMALCMLEWFITMTPPLSELLIAVHASHNQWYALWMDVGPVYVTTSTSSASLYPSPMWNGHDPALISSMILMPGVLVRTVWVMSLRMDSVAPMPRI